MAIVIPLGCCQCGCGQKTTVPTKTDRSIGRIRGVPMRFVQGHYADRKERAKRGSESHRWKGGRTKNAAGYIIVRIEGKRVYEHRLVMERAIGRPLKTREHVHHINGDVTDNRLENLMLFPGTAEHHRHHADMRRKVVA